MNSCPRKLNYVMFGVTYSMNLYLSEIYPYQRMYDCEKQEEFANFVYRGFQN